MQANGQKETINPIKARVIHDKFSKFNAETAEEYEEKLKKMSSYELSDEAVRIGYPGGVERKRIVKTLLDDFKKSKTAYEIASGKYTKPDIQLKNPPQAVKNMIDFIRS